MKRTTLAGALALALLAALVLCGQTRPAPTPDADRDAKARLEALKKRLPALVAGWAKKRWYASAKVKVQVARLTAPAEAKLTLLSEAYDGDGRRDLDNDHVLTIHLRYHDGAWLTARFDASWQPADHWSNRAVRFLMLAIDESEGK
jgi:hypothetical protein